MSAEDKQTQVTEMISSINECTRCFFPRKNLLPNHVDDSGSYVSTRTSGGNVIQASPNAMCDGRIFYYRQDVIGDFQVWTELDLICRSVRFAHVQQDVNSAKHFRIPMQLYQGSTPFIG